MRNNRTYNIREKCGERGQALVELAIALPLLVLLIMGVVDYSRAIHAKSIITNMSREAANLVSRANVNLSNNEAQDFPNVMNLVGKTAQPLDMANQGMMYISKVEYANNNPPNKITTYIPWSMGMGTSIPYRSKINPNNTNVITNNVYVTPANLNGITLASGEPPTYVVEIFYKYKSILLGNKFSPTLYTISIF